jgi:hypothetical protein
MGCQAKPPAQEEAKTEKQGGKVDYKAKIAIVLDDWGYSKKLVNKTLGLKTPVTFSVLPNLAYSTYVAKEAHQAGYEVILHLPMESKSHLAAEKEYLNSQMNEEEISAFLEKSLESVPYADAVSNHQGSKATEDKELMQRFFVILSAKDLFFLDSCVTYDSCAAPTAADCGLKTLTRNVFLDNKSDFDYIKGQFEELQEKALERGEAVGIGHARATTIEALEKLIPEAKENNIEFIFLSELLN